MDTNTVCRWNSQHPKIVHQIDALSGGTVVRISSITLGELECSHNLFVNGRDASKINEFVDFVERQFPDGRILTVGRHTREYYGKIRAALIEKYVPDKKGRSKNPEDWYDPVLASKLGIGENDLWIAAQAVELSTT
jgi:predicted nucleic acid-binding protein